jgi:hypothetical protein
MNSGARIEQYDILDAFTTGPNRFEIGGGDVSGTGSADDDKSDDAHGGAQGLSFSFRE